MDSNLKQSLSKLLAQYNTMHINDSGHDNRYYTKPQIDTFMESIATSSALTDLRQELEEEISRAKTAENLKAPLNSPAFEGIPVAPTASLGNSSKQLANTEFVQNSMDDEILNSKAIIIQGEIGTNGDVTELPSVYKIGWAYKVVSAGTYAGHVCEIGDIVVSFVSREDGDTPEDSDWSVIQTNIDGAITDIDNGDGYITISRTGDNVTIGHKDIPNTPSTSAESPGIGGSITAIKSVSTDSKGHVTGVLTTTFTLPKYTAGAGLLLSGKTFSNSGVRSIATGGTNGTISVNTNGTSADVAVKGLGSAAYTNTSAYATASHTHNYAGSTSAGGSANSATKLSTARTLTIGSTGKTFDGSANVSWSLSEIGAAAASHSHSYLPLSGGNMTGNISYNGYGTSYIGNGSADACNGVGGTLNNLVIASWWGVSFTTPCAGQTYTNKNAVSIDCRNGYVYANAFSGSLSGNASTATKLSTARTLTIGSTGKTFDGSANVSWSLSEIGAAAASHSHSGLDGYNYASDDSLSLYFNNSGSLIPSPSSSISLGDSSNCFHRIYATSFYENGTSLSSKYAASGHTHSYLPLSGGTLTGAVTFANGTYNTVGDDVAIGDINVGGVLGIIGKNGNTAIQLVNYGASTTTGTSVTGVRWTCTGNGTSTISGTTSGSFSGSLSGNATSATSLQTSRTLTIGNTGKSFNGTANVSWSLSEIGAAASSHTHSYLPLSGGTMTGVLYGCNTIPTIDNNYYLGSDSRHWSGIYVRYIYGLLGLDIDEVPFIRAENYNQTVYHSVSKTEMSSKNVSVGTNGYGTSTILRGKYIYFDPYMAISSSATIATASDEKVKVFTDDIANDEEKLVKLFDLIKPKSYNYKYSKSDNLNIGFSAQDIEQAMIELDISPEKYGILNIKYAHMLSRGDDLEDSKFYTKYYEVSYDDLFSLSLLKINVMEKQHVARLESLEERLATLENK